MQQISSPLLTKPVLLFVNPKSGGGFGLELMNRLQDSANVFIVQLPAEEDTWHIRHHDLLSNSDLRAVAAGGDGTVSWVISILTRVFTGAFRPPLAIIPLGTGNDMSRSLGWGPGMDNAKLRGSAELFRRIRASGNVKNVDIWNLHIAPSGGAATDRQMLNYFSVGVDAEVARDFEQCRTGCCRCCFCCQCMSLACYFPVGLSNIFCKRNLRDYMEVSVYQTEDAGEEPVALATRFGEKTLVLQAIPSMYAGRDAWLDHGPRAMDDHKFEIAVQGGIFRVGLLQIGCRTGRPVMQSTKTVLKIAEPFYYQVDGEGDMVNGPAEITVSRIGSYPMVFGEEA